MSDGVYGRKKAGLALVAREALPGDLCESCGMCCNGTLYTYVTAVPEDLPRLAKYPQLRFTQRNEQATFDEPCVLHTGTCCSAYDDRPATCSRYSCGVLRRYDDDELSEPEARALISEALALIDNVREYVEFEAGLPIAVSTWEDPPEHIAPEARDAWARAVYHLGRHFLGTISAEVEPPPAAPLASSPAFGDAVQPRRPRVTRASLFRPDV